MNDAVFQDLLAAIGILVLELRGERACRQIDLHGTRAGTNLINSPRAGFLVWFKSGFVHSGRKRT
jgi:hypothetical protein